MDLSLYFQAVAALAVVLGLIGAIGWAAKRFDPRRFGGPRGRDRRLGIVEVLSLDAKHRVVLVRRDDAEHLLLLGSSGPGLVIESGITPPRSVPFTLPAAERREP